MPDACIGVDVIVGFPGESEDNFQCTYDFLDSLDISYLHVFSYSMRDNTDAVKIEIKTPQDIISKRSKILHRLSIEKKHQFYKNNIGNVKQILIEDCKDGFLFGHSENYIPVKIIGEPNDVNQILPIKLIQIKDDKMLGEKYN